MSLYEKWISFAHDKNGKSLKKAWDVYIPKEQKIYETILAEKQTRITGTVEELSKKFDMPAEYICGFVDGIKEALVDINSVDIENMDMTTQIDITTDFEKLYKKMVEYKAEHLYSLPQWDMIFSEEQRKAFFIEQKSSGTYVRGIEKIGRNDPCSCGSGKKYKKCCGSNIG